MKVGGEGNWLVFILLLTIQRAWAIVTGSLEAIFYLGDRKKAKRKLKDAQKSIQHTLDLEFWYKREGISAYKRDWLDRWSFPWVTIAKKKGDCEDFMLLAHSILKKNLECHQCLVYGKKGGKRSGHAVLLVKEGDRWALMSNYNRYIWFDTMDDAAKKFYGEDTASYYIF
ncbi:MAG: hypothetical protein GF334_08540 [Candidatus Altiarchaeales archaeon]|nr:hypothetical protein [Candidatus Altiarchaeales archaeon]